MLFEKFILLCLCTFVAYSVGYVFTETKYDLASKSDFFDFKAFKCRKCLSFHASWFLTTSCSLILEDWIMFLVGIFFSVMLYIGLREDEKERLYK